MTENNGNTQLVAQWITSIAISVVCCAVLFVVFAGYIVDLNTSIKLMTVRLEVSQENQVQLLTEIGSLRKLMAEEAKSGSAQTEAKSVLSESAAPVMETPPATGVEITEPAPADPDEQGSIAPVMGSSAPQIVAPTRKDKKPASGASDENVTQ